MSKSKISLSTLVTLAMLTAIEIVLSRFLSISLWNMKIGLSFIPIMIAAIMYGPLAAGAVAALGDFIGAILFPIGAYFPGFTVTAFVLGCIFGIFMRGELSMKKGVIAVLLAQIVCTLFMNTGNISILYGSPFWPLFVTRLAQAGIMAVVQIVLYPVLHKTAELSRRRVKTA